MMIQALACLKRDSSTLMAALELFIREPTMDWMDLAKKQAGIKKMPVDETTFAKIKVNMVRMKLTGMHPGDLAAKELKLARRDSDEKLFRKEREVLLGPDGSKRRQFLSKKSLSVDEQVDCLLEASTDFSILRCAFRGWSPLS
jgi:DICT domain-containing protein